MAHQSEMIISESVMQLFLGCFWTGAWAVILRHPLNRLRTEVLFLSAFRSYLESFYAIIGDALQNVSEADEFE